MEGINYLNNLKVYLAGKIGGISFYEAYEWREEIKTMLEKEAHYIGCNICVINPLDYYNYEEITYQSEREVEDFDLKHVITSDIVVANLDGLNTSDGTKLEIFEAYRHYKIPVIVFGDKNIYDNLHPWIKSKITRYEPDASSACNYIREYYMF